MDALGHTADRGANIMWLLLPLAGMAAGYYLGRESPGVMWTIILVCCVTIAIGLGDPALAVQLLGCIIVLVIGLVILYNIIPILLFLLGAGIAVAFIIVVFAGIFRLAGV
jgi:hypothetical protein